MMSVLDEIDSQSLMWMRGKSGGTLVTEHAVFEVEQLEQTMTASPERGHLHLELTLKASDNEENREALMEEAKRSMEAQCLSLLQRLQQLRLQARFPKAVWVARPTSFTRTTLGKDSLSTTRHSQTN